MKLLTVTTALGAVLAMGSPAAASAASARNIVLVHGAFADASSWDKVAGLLRALSDRLYGDVLLGVDEAGGPVDGIRMLLTRYHDAVVAHPQLTLAIFAEPAAFAGATREITDRLTALLAVLTPAHLLWRDILVDHAHGSGLAVVAARGDAARVDALRIAYRHALACLLAQSLAGEP